MTHSLIQAWELSVKTSFHGSETDFPRRKEIFCGEKKLGGYQNKTTAKNKNRSTNFSSTPNTWKNGVDHARLSPIFVA